MCTQPNKFSIIPPQHLPVVEDLSDRIMAMEDDNIALRATIRDLEEAAELTQEMEEVQTEELRALTQDLEGRDTIIRNLEEAIKM